MIKVWEVPLLSRRPTLAFVSRAGCCGGSEEMDMTVYPPSPEGRRLRGERVKHEVSLRELSKRTGLTVVQVSALERGAMGTDERGWAELFRKVCE